MDKPESSQDSADLPTENPNGTEAIVPTQYQYSIVLADVNNQLLGQILERVKNTSPRMARIFLFE